MDELKHARAIKAKVNNNISVVKPPEEQTLTRPKIEEDEENQIIKSLRDDEKMKWTEITNYLNEERRKRGEAPIFTNNAVYSRYVRLTPKVATTVGEIGFDTKDYMHLRNPNQYTRGGDGTGIVSKAGKKRVKNYDNAKELEANMRQKMNGEKLAELETTEKTEQLVEVVAKVERNFWHLVANEMERTTTRYYPANALASRYHAI